MLEKNVVFTEFSQKNARAKLKIVSRKKSFSFLTFVTDFTKKIKNKRFTVWKNEKFGLTEKIFRQINSLVICLVKPLLS